MKVWDRAGIELATPGSAVRFASVARRVADCATQPGLSLTSFWTRIVPYDISNMVIYVTLTVLTKLGNIFLISYHLKALIFFVNEV